jgi:hypothetical protein
MLLFNLNDLFGLNKLIIVFDGNKINNNTHRFKINFESNNKIRTKLNIDYMYSLGLYFTHKTKFNPNDLLQKTIHKLNQTERE